MSVSAKSCKQFVAGFECIQQMKRCDRPARTVGFFCLLGNYQRRTARFFDYSRSHNPTNTTVPAVAIKDHAELPCQIRLSGKLLFNLCDDALLFRLTLQIELVQFFRDLFAPDLVFARE